jgi:putative transposase
VKFAFIDAEKASFPISRMCRVLGVSQSGFFAWQERPACRRQQQDMVHLAHIRTAFALSNGTYGSPRMHRDLVEEGHEIGRHRTARLMRENQLIARQKRRFKRTTDSEHAWPVAPNLVAQDCTTDGPDRKGSRHLLHLDSGGLALSRGRAGSLLPALAMGLEPVAAPWLDVGWATSDRLKRALAVEALHRALVARNPASGLVHHSDRGSQYCSVDHQALLRKRGILISMSGRGNCYDNSMVLRRENSPLDRFLILLTFFKTIKSELIWPVAWQSRQQAENAVARYIEGFHNPVRRHSSRGFQSPIAFKRKAREVS